jgi:hypothetical protein
MVVGATGSEGAFANGRMYAGMVQMEWNRPGKKATKRKMVNRRVVLTEIVWDC